MDVVTQVSVTTSFKTFSILYALQKLHTIPIKKIIVKIIAATIAAKSLVSKALMFKLKFFDNIIIGIKPITVVING